MVLKECIISSKVLEIRVEEFFDELEFIENLALCRRLENKIQMKFMTYLGIVEFELAYKTSGIIWLSYWVTTSMVICCDSSWWNHQTNGG
jgi:hypothetical protein